CQQSGLEAVLARPLATFTVWPIDLVGFPQGTVVARRAIGWSMGHRRLASERGGAPSNRVSRRRRGTCGPTRNGARTADHRRRRRGGRVARDRRPVLGWRGSP